MSRTHESLRRKDNCVECKVFKPIKAKNMCQNCWHKFKRKNEPNFYLRTRYTEVVQRCKGHNSSKYYKGLEYCTRQEFLDTFLTDKTFLKLFKNWQDNNFLYTLCPSIDRIDKHKGYVVGNMQFITHGENSSKDNATKLNVSVFDRDGNHLGDFTTLDAAARRFKVQQANAWKVLYKIRKHTCGYVFKFTT